MMWTASGKLVDPCALERDIEKVTLYDIAWALSQTMRWGGHARPGISVARHAIACARAAGRKSSRLGLLALHHDDGEAFFGDMPRDLKSRPEMAWYREQEHRATEICVRHFAPQCQGLALSAVKEVDNGSLLWERANLLPRDKEPTTYLPDVQPLDDDDFAVTGQDYVAFMQEHLRLSGLCA